MIASIFVALAFYSEGGGTELPSILSLLTGHDSPVYHWVNVIYAFSAAILLCTIAFVVYRRRKMIPGPLQNVLEMLTEGMYNLIHSILGKDTKTYFPLLATLFFYILVMNLMGIVPGGHSPSTNVNLTASLAILVFLRVQYVGFVKLGPLKYLDHLLGQPRGLSWIAAPFALISELIGVFAKPFSLAIRLFGNITGEDILIASFVGLGISFMGIFGTSVQQNTPIGVPFQIPFYALGLLLSTIQALVFTLLSTIYILMMLPHEEHH